LGIAILGYLVQRLNAERLSFADYVSARILRPLRLFDTGFPRDDTGEHASHLAQNCCTGYARFGSTLVPTPGLHPLAAPANALLTTPTDFARLLLTIMNGGTTDDADILKPETARLMVTPQVEVTEGMEDSGLWNGIGLEMTRVGHHDFSFGHGGVQPWGWWNDAEVFPSSETVVVACCNRWDMPRWYNPRHETAQGLLVEFVRHWTKGDQTVITRGTPTRSWPWRASWAMGFLLVERTLGLLGAADAVDEADIERLAECGATAEGNRPDLWDPDGFRAGARAMLDITPNPASIRGYLESGEAPVTTADFPLLALSFGHRGGLAIPQPFFAASAEDAAALNSRCVPAALGLAAGQGGGVKWVPGRHDAAT
jgi:hypothetical protein